MAKQLNVNIGFTADTSKAKAQLQDLQRQLTSLINNPTQRDHLGITKELREASVVAASLKTQLENATNVNTGRLDLGKFNQSLKESGYTISKISDALYELGPGGQKAFNDLAKAISVAEVPLKRTNALVAEFQTTLANTARWQISSSILHGTMGAMQSALGYAKDLNKSLNDIRIVTGYSTDKMAEFAARANDAAKALSTTTTAYTESSLLYYQQGLTDAEVQARTNTTAKMANATGETASDVASYMTAIWNNFAKGSDNLEHFGDVIMALGAATASSSDEIAEGLSKFASVADTIGLSYDYATSILASLVSNTRQSAEVIGTSLKTILARLQSVNIGETLDDGVTLSKYTKALDAIGVSVLDLNGELRNADDILNDTAAKWNELTKAQQAGVAQTVAGVRQYSQFIAIMENWDDIQKNLVTAKNADGTLEKQSQIYAESWEAARKRVKAAAQDIYDTLLNDEFFINFNDAFATALGGVSDLIDGLGGLKGVILTLSTLMLKLNGDAIGESMRNFAYSMTMTTEKGKAAIANIREQFNNETKELLYGRGTMGGLMTAEAYASEIKAQQVLLDKSKDMSESQKKIAEILMDQHSTLVKNAAEQEKIATKAEDEFETLLLKKRTMLKKRSAWVEDSDVNEFAKQTQQSSAFNSFMGNTFKGFSKEALSRGGEEAEKLFKQMKSKMDALRKAYVEDNIYSNNFGDENAEYLLELEKLLQGTEKYTEEIGEVLDTLRDRAKEFLGEALDIREQVQIMSGAETDSKAADLIDDIANSAEKAGLEVAQLTDYTVNAIAMGEGMEEALEEIPKEPLYISDSFVALAQSVSATSMAIANLKGLTDTWKDDSKGVGEKLLTTFTSLSFTIPMVVSSFKGLKIEQIATLSQAIATAMGFNYEAASAIAASKAADTLTASLGATAVAAWPILALTAGLAAVGVAFWAIAEGVKATEAASPKGVLKSAQEAADGAALSANQTAAAYQEVKSSIDDLDSGIKTIEELERGTLEWKQAILESNNALIELLSNYDMLDNNNFITDLDGLMSITEEAKELMQKKALDRSKSATEAKIAADIRKNDAELAVKKDEKVKGISLQRYNDAGVYEAGGENSILAKSIASAVAEGLSKGRLNSDDLVNGTDRLSEALHESTDLTYDEIASVMKQISGNDDFIKHVGELSVAITANTEANNVLSAQLAESKFGDEIKEADLTDKGKENLKLTVSKDIEKKTQELYESKYKDKGRFGGGLTDEEIQKRYATEMDYSVELTKNLKNNLGEYFNKAGESIGQIPDETARFFLAQKEVEEQIKDTFGDYVASISELTSIGNTIADKAGDALASFSGGLGGDLSSLNEKNKKAFMDSVSDYNANSNTFKLGENEVNQGFAEKLGYDSVKAFYDAIQAASTSYDNKVANIGKDVLSKFIIDTFNSVDKSSEASAASKEALANIMEKAFEYNGKESAESLAKILNDNQIDIDSFVESMQNIDWKVETLNSFKEKMSSVGYATEMTEETLNALFNTLRDGRQSVTSGTEAYKTLHDVIDDLKNGDTISEEDLEKIGKEYENFFLKMADGSYKLAMDAQKFYDMVNGKSVESFRENIEKILSVKNSGFDRDKLETSASISADSGKVETNNNQAAAQLDFLDAVGYEDIKKLQEWRTELAETKELTVESAKEISEAVKSQGEGWNGLDATLAENQERLASTATNLRDLKGMLDEGTISVEAYSKAALAMDEANDLKNLKTEELKEYSEYLRDAAKNMDGFNESMSKEESQVVAKGIMKMNNAVETLSKSFEEWRDTIEKSEEGSQGFADAMISTKGAVAELLDVSSEYVSSDFVKSHLDEIAAAAEGDAQAIDDLKASLKDEIVGRITLENNLGEEFASQVQDIQDYLDSQDLTVGATLESEEFTNKCNALISQAGLTVDQANALFDSLGFETNFSVESVPVERKGHEVVTTTRIEGWGEAPLPDGSGIYRFPAKIATQTDAGAPYDYTEYVDVMAMQASSKDGSKKTPKISGVTKKAGGSANNKSSSNAGGGSGKKSGGGKEKQRDVKKPQKAEIDPYHDIQRSINKVSDAMSTLDKKKSHLFGGQLIGALKEENGLLETQLANYKEMGNVISGELSRIQGDLSKYGVSFDGVTGEMLNYAEAYAQALAAYNAAINAYNLSAQEDADKDALERAQENYQNFTKMIGEYDSTLDKRMANEQSKLDAQYKIIENNYKAWETEIQISLDLDEAKREWTKFWQKVNKDVKSAFKDYAREIADITENFDLMAEGTMATDLKAINDIKAEINKMASGQDSDRYVSETEAAEDLLKYSNQLKQDAEELYGMYEDAWNEYLDGIDQVVDKWEAVVTKFDDINASLEHNAKLIELLYRDGDMANSLNAQRYNVQRENGLFKMDTLRQAIESLEKERDALIAAGAKETDEDVKKLTEAIKQNSKEMQSSIEDYLKTLTDSFKNSVTMAMREMEKAMTKGTSYDSVSKKWDDARYAAKGYYDDVEKIYQIETMESKWQAAITSSKSLKAQQKLTELMDSQIKSLDGKNKLTEYDIQLAEKQLAVAQAQMALEDAQNAKNSMKLTRDEAGNWSYQYVADDSDVADKQQALRDANQEWYEFTKQAWHDLTEEIWQDAQTAQERLTALMEEYNTADENRRKEITEQYDYLYNYYYGEDGIIATKSRRATEIQNDLNISMMNTLWGLYEEDKENFNLMTEEEKALTEALREEAVNQFNLLKEAVAGEDGVYSKMKDKCEETNAESLETWKETAKEIIATWSKDPDSLQKNVESMYAAVKRAQSDYDNAVRRGVAASGREFDKIGGPGGSLERLGEKTQEAQGKLESLLGETDAISNMRAAVEDLRAAWEDVSESIQDAIDDLETYLAILSGGSYQGSSRNARNNNAAAHAQSQTQPSPAQSTSAPAAAGSGDGNLTVGETVTYTGGTYYEDEDGGGRTGSRGPGKQVKVTQIREGSKYPIHVMSSDSAYGWLTRSQLSGFDTGGYTGDWNGKDGKLAMLHSKELVLNKEDTGNILQAVAAVRSISSIGSSVAESITNGIANMVNSLLNLKGANYNGSTSNNNTENANNTFDITMNVDGGNVEEIKSAILSLPTLASQYLSRK